MQSEECRHIAGVSEEQAWRYAVFQLAGLLTAPAWRNALSLAFPPGDVIALEGSAVTPACFGLLGTAGTLPYSYTEAVARAGSTAARDFMDLLSVPAFEAFCAAWREARPEYAPLPAIPARRGPPRARVLGEQFAQALGVPVRIEQFAGRWDPLPPQQRSSLGGANALCGGGALLGERLRRPDSALRIHIGPLGRQAAQDFLPGCPGAQALARLWCVSGAADGGLQAEAYIHLQPGAGETARLGGGTRLGYDALLPAAAAGGRDDLRYRLC